MAFKLTYTDGQADDYDDSTKWEVDDGVLKMGRKKGEWTVLVSPSHWATIEIRPEKDEREEKPKDKGEGDKDKDKDKDKDEDEDKDEDKDEDEDTDEDDEDDSEDDK